MQIELEELTSLLIRVGTGDREAFASLYSLTGAHLFGTAVRLLKRRDLAEEVTQDAYVTIMQKAGTYDPTKGAPLGWMVAIVRNRALDILRQNTPLPLEEASLASEIADDEPDALAALTAGEDVRRLLDCLDTLEPHRKEMVVLAYLHGESREQLGARYNCPTGTIKTWLHRSLGRLKDCMTAQ